VARLNRLVNDFLLVGRPTPPALADCDIRRTLNETLTLVEKQAGRQNIEISMKVPNDVPVLKADGVQLKTCFLNILTNAIQAMPNGGSIQLAVRTLEANGRGRCLELRFSDNGPGIPAEDRERVFTPYFSTKTTGFGLGLAITKKIVEDHGGRIYATAAPIGGTEMVMELPLPAARSTMEPAASTPAA
jgi:two-component system, NtrC family, sensor histidine kinase HydH